ncbi:MAG TPA: hypothetical protein VHF47_08370 [Acidimicrobiales bacterium]|nr:hypothetical protein [Acidimicrobiales bacterium]
MHRIASGTAGGRQVVLSLLLLAAFGPSVGVGSGGAARVEGVQFSADKEKNKPAGPHGFRITGSAGGLFPGIESAPLPVTVRNDNNFAIAVEELGAAAVAVGDAVEPCPLAVDGRPTVVVTPYRGSLSIPPKGTASHTLAVSMDAGAPDGCSGATFQLAFSGRAVKP